MLFHPHDNLVNAPASRAESRGNNSRVRLALGGEEEEEEEGKKRKKENAFAVR